MSSVKLRKEKDCLNCGHIVEENFCPKCGQENIVTKEDAFHMVTHAIADYFHFEHKFFGTIGPLLLKPGRLTKEYVAGKRMSSIHPIRLYIFISIVFFLVVLGGKKFGENSAEGKEDKNTTADTTKTVSKPKDTVVKKQLTAAQINEIKESLKYVPNGNGLRDSIIKKAIAEEESGKAKDDNGGIRFGKGKKKGFSNKWATKDTSVVQYEKNQATLAKDKRDGFIKHYFIKRTIELDKYENPEEKFLEDFIHNIPKMMFLLLPMFALILKLVYINKKRYYYEHLIYSFHLHSAIFLSILATMLLQWLFGFIYDIDAWLGILCAIYIIWYIYRSLRTFYGSTRWITVLKMFFLSFAYNIVLTICFLIVIAVSFVTI
ncbi:DUF3667 domain-containing protein [Pedobacter frigiditerrae]|uniref:DUF3667 domain-containing protein n=1 Tax=Pedobacter frigiditerrae TaxID=2530452 RepID=A0A4R0MTM0_9SPHI|nr:DUF3667 domain-containing protein [Pedobacter frigiditerrae]TCC90429.1 DUF3667 domain-containing protein [Pedobacter frigiditerrae]